MDPRYQPGHDGMDPSDDPRASRPAGNMEAGPSRCNMEASFMNILHSSGFAEWAARAEEQNRALGVSSWEPERQPSTPSSSDSKSSRKSSSSRSSHKTSSSKKGSRSRKSKDREEKGSKSRSSRSKTSEATVEEEEEEMDEAENFVAHYANYNSMDTELNILRKHLMQRTSS